MRIIEGMDECCSGCCLQLTCMRIGIRKGCSVQDDAGPISLRCHNFHQWGMLGHHNRGRDSKRLGGKSDALGMITHRCCNHPMRPLLLALTENLIGGSTHLEGSCSLQI